MLHHVIDKLEIDLGAFDAYDIVRSDGQHKLVALHRSGTWVPLYKGTFSECESLHFEITAHAAGGADYTTTDYTDRIFVELLPDPNFSPNKEWGLDRSGLGWGWFTGTITNTCEICGDFIYEGWRSKTNNYVCTHHVRRVEP